jgi:hypothetical protein
MESVKDNPVMPTSKAAIYFRKSWRRLLPDDGMDEPCVT